MTGLIVDSIVTTLKTLDYITRAGGIVTPAKVEKQNQNYTMPIIRNTDKGECNPSEFIDFVPDDRETVMVYFEERGPANVIGETTRYKEIEHDLRLVAWINSKKFGAETVNAQYEILQTLPVTINITPLSLIQIEIDGIAEKDPVIFDKYGYDSSKNQYLIYPFDYFSINITVKYRITLGCDLSYERNPIPC